MSKQIVVLIFSVLVFNFVNAQPAKSSYQVKSLFEGRWKQESKSYNHIIEIHFAKGKDSATYTDMGTGDEPPLILEACLKGAKLIVTPQEHVADYCEMEIENNKLVFKTQPTIRDAEGNARPPKRKNFITLVFKKMQ